MNTLTPFSITPCTVDTFNDMVHFICQLNQQPARHIAYLGVNPLDVQLELLALTPPPTDGSFLLARRNGEITGVFGAEYDEEIGRAWLFGPFVESPDGVQAEEIANALFTQVAAALPPEIQTLEMFLDIHNTQGVEFALRHGFARYKNAAILRLARQAAPTPAPSEAVRAYHPIDYTALENIHNQAFPNTYYTARQIAEMHGEERQMLVVGAPGKAEGYIFFKTEPETGEAHIDFLAIAAGSRGRGLGETLLRACIQQVFADPALEGLNLVVDPDNTAARSLYAKLGFETERITTSFRRSVNSG